MAAQLRDAFFDFRLQHPRQTFRADLFEVGLPAPLAVKF